MYKYKDRENIEYKYLKLWLLIVLIVSIIILIINYFINCMSLSIVPLHGSKLKEFTPAYPPPLFNFM
jgi:hypothetical protein